jgi:hypothetical protein
VQKTKEVIHKHRNGTFHASEAFVLNTMIQHFRDSKPMTMKNKIVVKFNTRTLKSENKNGNQKHTMIASMSWTRLASPKASWDKAKAENCRISESQ